MNGTTEQINATFGESDAHQLRISMGPGNLRLKAGDGPAWAEGTYSDPSDSIPLQQDRNGDSLRFSQKRTGIASLRQSPTLELALGTAKPFEFTLDAGAIDVQADLGGLPITKLNAQLGAGTFKLDASKPLMTPLTHLKISAGAAEFTALNLANFNASRITIEGGAASFLLNFGGALQRDCEATCKVGVASLELTLPSTIAAKITTKSVLGSLDIGDGFMTRNGAYWTEAAVRGETPVLTLHVTTSIGSMKISIQD